MQLLKNMLFYGENKTMKYIDALGAVELVSIAKGIEVSDAMLKKAAVELLYSRIICPGKYLSIISGSVSETKDALDEGLAVGGDMVADSIYLTNPHVNIMPALAQATMIKNVGALGIIETFSMCSAIEAADIASKQAEVMLIDVRISIMLSGKSYISLTGQLSGVQNAVEAALEVLKKKGVVVASVIIPSPREELHEHIM